MMEIPVSLARILVVEKKDLKDPSKYEDSQEVAKGLLKVLLAANMAK